MLYYYYVHDVSKIWNIKKSLFFQIRSIRKKNSLRHQVHVHIIMACSWTHFCVFEVAWPVWVDANVPGMYFQVGLMFICLFLDTVLCLQGGVACSWTCLCFRGGLACLGTVYATAPDMYFSVGLMLICLFLDTVLCFRGGMACSWMHLCTWGGLSTAHFLFIFLLCLY